HDEQRGCCSTYRNEGAGHDVCARRDALPTIEIHTEENRLGEKREALERKGHADDGARESHEARPQQAELEADHRPRYRADGEEDGRAFGPTLRELEIHRVTGASPARLGDD